MVGQGNIICPVAPAYWRTKPDAWLISVVSIHFSLIVDPLWSSAFAYPIIYYWRIRAGTTHLESSCMHQLHLS